MRQNSHLFISKNVGASAMLQISERSCFTGKLNPYNLTKYLDLYLFVKLFLRDHFEIQHGAFENFFVCWTKPVSWRKTKYCT